MASAYCNAKGIRTNRYSSSAKSMPSIQFMGANSLFASIVSRTSSKGIYFICYIAHDNCTALLPMINALHYAICFSMASLFRTCNTHLKNFPYVKAMASRARDSCFSFNTHVELHQLLRKHRRLHSGARSLPDDGWLVLNPYCYRCCHTL